MALAVTAAAAWTGYGDDLTLGEHTRYLAAPFDLRERLGARVPRRLDRLSEMAVLVSAQALRDRDWNAIPAERRALFFATGLGNLGGTIAFLERLQQKGPRFSSPLEFPNLVLSAPTGTLSLQFGVKGELLAFNQGALSGLHALIAAHDCLSASRADTALVVGVEELTVARQRFAVLTGDRRPLGEGAAAVVLGQAGVTDVMLSGVGLSGVVGLEGAEAALAMAKDMAGVKSVDRLLTRKEYQSHADAVDIAEAVGYFDVVSLVEVAVAWHLLSTGSLRTIAIVAAGKSGGAAAVLTRSGR